MSKAEGVRIEARVCPHCDGSGSIKINHGVTGYVDFKCRCDECRAANAARAYFQKYGRPKP